MGERSSFVTEFIYCPDCFAIMKTTLAGIHKDRGKYIHGKHLKPYPIIAGYAKGVYSSIEIIDFMYRVFDEKKAPCHSVRVAIMLDSGDSIVALVKPDGDIEQLINISKEERERQEREQRESEWQKEQERINRLTAMKADREGHFLKSSSAEEITTAIQNKTIVKCEIYNDLNDWLELTFTDGIRFRFKYDWIYKWEIKGLNSAQNGDGN